MCLLFSVPGYPVIMARPIVFVTGNVKKTEEFVAIMGKSFPRKVNCYLLHAYFMCS
jgi:hypothetical protein